MKQLFTITLLVISLITTAQNTAKPTQILGKDVYFLLLNKSDATSIGSIKVTVEDAKASTSLSNRIENVIKSSSQDFDAIMSRDGSNFILLKYNNSQDEKIGRVIKLLKKDIYLFSIPTKKFKVVNSKVMNVDFTQKSFFEIGQSYAKDDSVSFDGIIITNEIVEYIKYK